MSLYSDVFTLYLSLVGLLKKCYSGFCHTLSISLFEMVKKALMGHLCSLRNL